MNNSPADGPDDGEAPGEQRDGLPDSSAHEPARADSDRAGKRRRWKRAAVVVAGAAVGAAGVVLAAITARRHGGADDSTPSDPAAFPGYDDYDGVYASDDGEYDDEYDESESLSVWAARDIWMSSGMDEDYTFGYSDAELRHAAGLD